MKRETLFNTIVEASEQGRTLFRPILMQYAAHSIGKRYRDFYLDHKILVEANLHCLKSYNMDAVGLISDPARETEAFGAKFSYADETVPHCQDYPIKTLSDVEGLPAPDLMNTARTADRIAGAKLLKEKLGDSVPIIGWIEGPLAEACDLVGVSEMLMKLALEPEFCTTLMRKLTETAKSFARAQIDAGCNIIGMGDAICSQISPRMYDKYVKPLHAKIIKDIQAQDVMVKLHICGDTSRLLPRYAEIKPDMVDLDWMVDMDEAYQILGSEIIRTGNLDPANLIEKESAETVFNTARELVQKERGRPFILAGGCEITALTPHENLLAMSRAAKIE